MPGGESGHGIHRGPEDGSFRFAVRQDREFLYVAVDVRDDSIVVSPDLVAREQDHVDVSIDARPDPERSKNEETFVAVRNGSMAKLVSPQIALQETRPDPIIALFGSVPEGTRQAARRTATGYAVEVAIPAAVLDDRRGGRWDAVRVNVTMNDFDEGEPDHVTLSWRPSRFEAGAIEGAGTFVRQLAARPR